MSQKGITSKNVQERMTDKCQFEMNMLLGPTFYVCHLLNIFVIYSVDHPNFKVLEFQTSASEKHR